MERTVVTPPVNDDPPAGHSYLRVVRGDPTPEELAALIAVLLSRPAEPEAAVTTSRSAWSDRSGQLRRPLHPGPGGWRRSALPG